MYMKKGLLALIVTAMALSLCACGDKDSSALKDDSFAAAVDSEKNTTDSMDAGDDVQGTEVSSDRTMPEGLVDIYVSAGNSADFVFHADRSGVDDLKTISYRFDEYEISLSDFGEGYQCDTWNVSNDSTELAEEEDYLIDGSNYVIKAYITSLVPSFDVMQGTYELYYESRDGETYYYDLVWKDIVKQGEYVEGSQDGAGEGTGDMSFADIPSGEYVGKTLSNGDCSSFFFSNEGSGTYSTQFRLKNEKDAIIDNIDITEDLVVASGPDFVIVKGSNGFLSYIIVFSMDGEAKVEATDTNGITITDTLRVK